MVTEIDIKYGSNGAPLTAGAFLGSIGNIVKLLEELGREIAIEYDTNIKPDIKLKNYSGGGLGIVLELSTKGSVILDTLYGSPSELTEHLRELFDNYLKLARFLEGEEPGSIRHGENGLIVENRLGDRYTCSPMTYRIYSGNAAAGTLVRNIFEALNGDDSLNSLELGSGGAKSMAIDKTRDFPAFLKKVRKIDKTHQIINLAQAKLFLRVVFERNIKLTFFHKGVRLINVKVSDDIFISEIEKGRKIANGDQIIAELDIFQEWDDELNTFINKNYEIIRVREHVHRKEELQLFDLN